MLAVPSEEIPWSRSSHEHAFRMTLLEHPTHEWSSLQDVFYRKSEIYSLTWGVDDLSDHLVAASKNGGLFALTRDPHKLVSLGKAALLKPKVLIYTSAGQLVETLPVCKLYDGVLALTHPPFLVGCL